MKEVKVLLFNIDSFKIDESLFSFEDKKKLEQYTNEKTRREKTLSLYVKRKYVGEYHVGESGKPLADDKYFNISHKDKYLAFVLDEVPIGIDIEHIKPINERLIAFIANDQEKLYIKDELSFFEIWTNKEAITKAHGKGIRQMVETIPSLPLNSGHTFDNKLYYNRTVQFQDYVITVSREKDENYLLILEEVK